MSTTVDMMRAQYVDAPELTRLRAELDAIDAALVTVVAKRCEIARTLGELKRAAGLPLRDPMREAAVVRRAAGLARESGVCDERVRQLFWVLIEMSRGVQTERTA